MSETQSQPAGLTPEERAQRVSSLLAEIGCFNCCRVDAEDVREIEQHALALADLAAAAEAREAALLERINAEIERHEEQIALIDAEQARRAGNGENGDA